MTKTIPASGHVGKDGTLDLKIQTGLGESDVDVMVTIRLRDKVGKWPEGFIEEAYGCLADDPIQRPPQLPFEAREALN